MSKKLIKDGKIYDINSSEVIFEYNEFTPEAWTDGNIRLDTITIYKTRKGNYFQIRKCLNRGSLKDLTEDEVIRILESRQGIEELAKFFPRRYAELEEV